MVIAEIKAAMYSSVDGRKMRVEMTYVGSLKDILPVPQNVYNTGSEKAWHDLEMNTGIVFPKDHKELIGTYGTGGIGNFIWFLTPFEEDDDIDHFKKMNVMLEAYRISKNHFPDHFIHDIYPEKNGLLPWGYTDNGDGSYWKTNSSFEKWDIVIYERPLQSTMNIKCNWQSFSIK